VLGDCNQNQPWQVCKVETTEILSERNRRCGESKGKPNYQGSNWPNTRENSSAAGIIAGAGKRDYSRPLPSEPDVKVSLHPAQASRRPGEGPVSSRTTCWLYDTGSRSMPLRGR